MDLNLEVFRMSGAGNLFSVIDNRKYNFSDTQLAKLSKILCIYNDVNNFNAEGLLVMNDSNKLDFDVKFFNPDGSSGMMCGNGGRCALDFAFSKMFEFSPKSELFFTMANSQYYGSAHEQGIKLVLPPPIGVVPNMKIILNDMEISGTYVDVGSDHFVINHDDLVQFGVGFDKMSINSFAPSVRYHDKFGKKGVNVNIYKRNGDAISLITYERGVEFVTGACGTGAISTAMHCIIAHSQKMPVMIYPPSGIPLFVEFTKDANDNIENSILIGHSEIVRRDILKLSI